MKTIFAALLFGLSSISSGATTCPAKEIPLRFEGGCTAVTNSHGGVVLLPPIMQKGEEETGGCLFSFPYGEELGITFRIPHFGEVVVCLDGICKKTEANGFLSFDFRYSTDFPEEATEEIMGEATEKLSEEAMEKLMEEAMEEVRGEVRIFLTSEMGAISPPKLYAEDCTCKETDLGCPIDPPKP